MTQESEPTGMVTKEQVLADLMRQGITTLEELLDKTVPEVGGFMLKSGGFGATKYSEDTFAGDWYIYFIDTKDD
jgi:hypothetical protein